MEVQGLFGNSQDRKLPGRLAGDIFYDILHLNRSKDIKEVCIMKCALRNELLSASVALAAVLIVSAGLPASASDVQTEASAAEEEEVQTEEESKEPQSVAALSKSIGDLWLLSGGKLSGITDDGLKMDGIGDAVSIGSLAKPSEESILALDPDLVLLTGDIPSHKAVAEDLKNKDIPVEVIDIEKFADYDAYIREFTRLTGRDDLYEKNVTEVKSAIDDILKEKPEDAKGKTYLELRVSATKNKALKDDYFASEIFSDFGLINIASDDSSLDNLSVEAILAEDPDYIFVIPQGKEDEAKAAYEQAFTSDPAWQNLSAEIGRAHV